MTAYTNRIVKANQVWRQRFYDRFVTDLGLSVGAVVKVKKQAGWNTPEEEKIGIITSINWDQLSMFCYSDEENRCWSQRMDTKFRQQLTIQINVDGESTTMSFAQANPNRQSHRNRVQLLSDQHGGLVDQFTGYRCVLYKETVARSETPLDEEWVSQGHKECAKFVTKKYSREKLDHWNVTSVLEKTEEIQSTYLTKQ